MRPEQRRCCYASPISARTSRRRSPQTTTTPYCKAADRIRSRAHRRRGISPVHEDRQRCARHARCGLGGEHLQDHRPGCRIVASQHERRRNEVRGDRRSAGGAYLRRGHDLHLAAEGCVPSPRPEHRRLPSNLQNNEDRVLHHRRCGAQERPGGLGGQLRRNALRLPTVPSRCESQRSSPHGWRKRCAGRRPCMAASSPIRVTRPPNLGLGTVVRPRVV
jgi:hypothetical protein